MLFHHAKTLLIQAEHQFFFCAQQRAGIPTLPFLVTDSVKKIMTELGFPVIVFAVNPFIYDGYQDRQEQKRSISRYEKLRNELQIRCLRSTT